MRIAVYSILEVQVNIGKPLVKTYIWLFMRGHMVELVYPEEEINISEYNEFERLFVRDLPLSFQKQYLRINGGMVGEEDLENGLWGLPIGGFESIKYGIVPIERLIEDLGEIVDHDEGLVFKKWEYVPFAHDQGGNIIFVSLKGSSYDQVCIYAMDGSNIHFTKYNFGSFIDKLYVT